MPHSSYDFIELFHLHFLRHFSSRLVGRMYAVKGGICLRFFHRSPRLSQDLDLDIAGQVHVSTLKNAVDSILKGRAFSSLLESHGIRELMSSKPKQTETTQRWKIQMTALGGSPLQTKIEFSRRRKSILYKKGVPDPEILNRHKGFPFAVQYYDAKTMTHQKIGALLSPSRYALRDLFDLHHLLVTVRVPTDSIRTEFQNSDLEAAIDKIGEFSFKDFQSQVLPFLPPDYFPLYETSEPFEEQKAKTQDVLISLLS